MYYGTFQLAGAILQCGILSRFSSTRYVQTCGVCDGRAPMRETVSAPHILQSIYAWCGFSLTRVIAPEPRRAADAGFCPRLGFCRLARSSLGVAFSPDGFGSGLALLLGAIECADGSDLEACACGVGEPDFPCQFVCAPPDRALGDFADEALAIAQAYPRRINRDP